MINAAQLFLLDSVIPKEARQHYFKRSNGNPHHCVPPNPARAVAVEEKDKF